MNINKKIIYIKMDDKSAVFYTIVDNVQIFLKEIVYLKRRFPRGSMNDFETKNNYSYHTYFVNIHNYLKLFETDNITDNITEFVFNHICNYSGFVKSEKVFFKKSNITITSNMLKCGNCRCCSRVLLEASIKLI
jgi:hypothetical protein